MIQFLRAVGRICIEVERIPRPHRVDMRPVPIDHFSLENVDELNTIMLEQGKNIRGLRDHNQVGFGLGSPITNRMTQQVILVTCASATAVNDKAFARLYEGRLPILLVLAKKSGYRNIERSRKLLQRRQRRRCLTILDLGEHPRRQPCLTRQVGNRHPELSSVDPNLPADGIFKPIATLRDRAR